MKRLKGFTLVELVIVIAIVIILSVVSVPIYKNYTDKAKMSEGYALLGVILSAQKAFYSEKGYFHAASGSTSYFTSVDNTLGIDAQSNKYFTAFNSGYRYSEDTGLKYKFSMKVIIPEELRRNDSASLLILDYNLTSGSTMRISNI